MGGDFAPFHCLRVGFRQLGEGARIQGWAPRRVYNGAVKGYFPESTGSAHGSKHVVGIGVVCAIRAVGSDGSQVNKPQIATNSQPQDFH